MCPCGWQQVRNNSKWLKNFDKRPHHLLVTPPGYKWIYPILILDSINTRFLGPTRVSPQMASRSVHPFTAHPRDSSCFSVGWATPKIAHSPLGIWTAHTACFFGSTRVSLSNSISISSAIFAGFTNVTNKQTLRHTDRQTMLLRL